MKGVLAPVQRMSIVESWTTRKRTWPTGESPSTAWATWEMTVGDPLSYGTAWVSCASHDTPATREPSMMLIVTRVRRALRPWGRSKALTPLEIASSPVSEDPPLAKARSRM